SLIQEFVDGYNDVINYIASQSDADWGSDSAFRMVKRKMQDLLTANQSGGSGSFTTFSELGFETQRDGTISISSTIMDKALNDDFNGVVSLLAGETGVDGLLKGFKDYLDVATDFTDGIAASRKGGTDSNIRRIDSRISMMEARMVAREKTLRSQFSAMEQLVSSMNSQSAFLAQQMSNLSNMNR
ncbi:MAG: flagellar filament capping protein FliD, partial [Deltaproteobacteria bacterium]|nr:flagellar filament capping protein FliD [Deltaproteobacteria bacterium]